MPALRPLPLPSTLPYAIQKARPESSEARFCYVMKDIWRLRSSRIVLIPRLFPQDLLSSAHDGEDGVFKSKCALEVHDVGRTYRTVS